MQPMKKLIILLFVLFNAIGFSQTKTCDCKAYFNFDKVDHKDSITKSYYKKIRPSYVDECNNVKIIADSIDYFKVIAYTTDQNPKEYKAKWLKKTSQFETNLHEAEESTIVLYENPDYKSKIVYYSKTTKLLISKHDLKLTLLNCDKTWIKVKLKVGSKEFFGWVKKGGHCPNPCTTCG
jgi:hypothetical protein